MRAIIDIAPEPVVSDKFDRSSKNWHFAGTLAVAAVIAAMYADVLASLVRAFWDEPRLSQGLLILPLAAYVAWLRRQELMETPPAPEWAGFVMVFAAAGMYVAGKVAAELFLPRLSFFALLAGLTLTFWGRSRLRILAFPLLLAATAVPLPALLYNRASASLQLLASTTATTVAQAFGIAVFQDGNIIRLARITFGVEEACNGLTALSSLVVTSLLLGFLTTPRIPVRVLIAVASVPLAVGINVVRVAGTAVLATYSHKIALGFYHSFSGWLVFVVGIGALYILAHLIEGTWTRVAQRRSI